MGKKYIITILGFSTLLVSSQNVAFAQTATSTAYPRIKHELQINPNRNVANTTASLMYVQQKADQLITQRLASLNNMLTKITDMTRLSAEQKATLTTNINNNITGLTNLKAKIATDTDVTTALADMKSIYTTYRVYAEFEPQTSMLAVSDALNKTLDQLTQLATKLQTRIGSASAAGNDVTTLNSLLTDMQNNIADAKKQAANAQTNVSNITPSDFNTSPSSVHTTFTNSHGLMSTARNDLRQAIQDATKIIYGLKASKTGTVVIPSAAIITPTPTV